MGQIWDAVQLCNVTPTDPENDITKEVGNIATLFQVSQPDLGGAVNAVYAAMKRELYELINTHWPDIYARYPFQGWPYNQWLQFLGYSYIQTDNLIELIRPIAVDGTIVQYTTTELTAAITAGSVLTIPDLTTTATAFFIKRAYIRLQSNMKASNNSGMRPYQSDILIWTDEAKSRARDCIRRLFIDFADSGQVIDTERGRVRVRRFSRG